MRLVIFDLDGTITWRDTFVPFVAGFLRRHPKYCLRLWCAPGALLRYLLAGRDRGRLKEALIIGLLRGVDRLALNAWTERFVDRLLARGCRPQALEQIRLHREERDHLVLLSASPDLYVPRIAERLQFNESVCTGVRWDNDTLDGHLTTQNRRGEEKARCLEDERRRHGATAIIAYGNSASDFAHLMLADEGWLISGRAGLIRRAKEMGLRSATWT